MNMDTLYYLFAAALLVTAILAAIAIWAPRSLELRTAAVILTAIFFPLAYASLTTLLSRPKPVDFAWFERNAETAHVLGIKLEEGSAIYLWLHVDGYDKPGFYVLPWRQSEAEHFQETYDAAVKQRGKLILKKPFSRPSAEEKGGRSLEIIAPPSPPMKPPQVPPRVPDPRLQDIWELPLDDEACHPIRDCSRRHDERASRPDKPGLEVES